MNEREKIERLRGITKEIFQLFEASGLNLVDIYFVLWGYLLAVQDKVKQQVKSQPRQWVQ